MMKFVDNYLHDNAKNQQIHIQSQYLHDILVFGVLFLGKKNNSSKFMLLNNFYNVQTYEIHLFLKVTKLWKDTIFIVLLKKSGR